MEALPQVRLATDAHRRRCFASYALGFCLGAIGALLLLSRLLS